ncbi:MAG: hypothetical protein ACRDKS_08995, partial [Actinomycetota bacterium]
SFTRFVGVPGLSNPRIYLARRAHVSDPFASPELVSSAAGFVEAASFTPDGNAIYYHHKVGGRYLIERLDISDSVAAGL